MSDYLTEGWPLSPTSTIYMDGTAVYGVRRYGIPGATNVVLRCEHADLIREVVAARIEQVRAEGAAQALRDAAEVWGAGEWQEAWLADAVEDDVSAVRSTVTWLRARADQIEAGR